MTDMMTWITTHYAQIAEGLAALYVLASIYVSLTPGKADDEALTRARAVIERLSFLQPRDGVGVFSLPTQKAKRPESRR